ncbi:hypothetical protein AB6846_24615, partial [Serratia proteamaculans]
TADLRQPLAKLPLPLLRVYGYLDGLVPRKVAGLLDVNWPHSPSIIIAKAAHAPFIPSLMNSLKLSAPLWQKVGSAAKTHNKALKKEQLSG